MKDRGRKNEDGEERWHYKRSVKNVAGEIDEERAMKRRDVKEEWNQTVLNDAAEG